MWQNFFKLNYHLANELPDTVKLHEFPKGKQVQEDKPFFP